MHQFDRSGIRLTLGTPRVVGEGVGHYWFPTIDRFNNGDLLVNFSLVADADDNLVAANAITCSRDGGETWEPTYDGTSFTGGRPPRFNRGDDAIAGVTYHVYPDPPGQARRVAMHRERFEMAGRRYVVEPYAAHLEGLPRNLAPTDFATPVGRREQLQGYLFGDVIDLGGELLTIPYVRYAGDARYCEIAVTSDDAGRTWRYLSTIAGPDQVTDAREGPCEATAIRLADGDLMCVMRVGSGAEMPLARTYSADDGKTWSPPDRLPARSVAPSLVRLHDGTLVLSTGRPGIYLWLSTDPRGETWQSLDVLAHHNSVLGAPHHVDPRTQTTAYTELVEVAPNRLLLVYDRTPFGWKPVPIDSDERNRIYVLPIQVERG